MERPELIFRGYAAAAMAPALVGIPLALQIGAEGAVVGVLLASAATAAFMAWDYSRAQRAKIRLPSAESPFESVNSLLTDPTPGCEMKLAV